MNVFHRRAERDPREDGPDSRAAFQFLTVAYLAKVERPPSATPDDKGLLRNCTCATCLQSRFLPLPRMALKK